MKIIGVDLFLCICAGGNDMIDFIRQCSIHTKNGIIFIYSKIKGLILLLVDSALLASKKFIQWIKGFFSNAAIDKNKVIIYKLERSNKIVSRDVQLEKSSLERNKITEETAKVDGKLQNKIVLNTLLHTGEIDSDTLAAASKKTLELASEQTPLLSELNLRSTQTPQRSVTMMPYFASTIHKITTIQTVTTIQSLEFPIENPTAVFVQQSNAILRQLQESSSTPSLALVPLKQPERATKHLLRSKPKPKGLIDKMHIQESKQFGINLKDPVQPDTEQGLCFDADAVMVEAPPESEYEAEKEKRGLPSSELTQLPSIQLAPKIGSSRRALR